MAAVYWKELADYFGNRLFAVVLLLIAVAAAWAAYTTTQDLREQAAGLSAEVAFLKLFTTQGDTPLSFLFFVGFFGPLLGLALGFDAVNSERARGTLGRILAQPIYRDALINGKFLAGATVLGISLLSLILIVIGIGLYTLGIAPSTDEAVRLTFFLGATLIYMALWLSLSILFSLLFDRAVMSALASIGVWLALTFFIPFFAVTIADQLVSDSEDAQSVATERAQWEQRVQRFSPAFLYEEATQPLLNPQVRTLGFVSMEDVQGIGPQPISLGQSLILVWPHLTGFLALASLIFAIAYLKFMKEEIRP